MSSDKPLLLVVEDDPGIQKQLKWCLDSYELIFANDRKSAIKQLRRFEPSVVTLDLGLPPDPANVSEGLNTLAEILALSPQTKVIVVTGNDDKDDAIKAISMGAYDYYQKPLEPDILSTILNRAFWVYELEQKNRLLASMNFKLNGVIGDSPNIQTICRRVEKIAKTEVTTLLLGESGTGKEVFARAIHASSNRSKGPFLAINCASIPENLLESELFGYERGAFTGAHKKTKGKIECTQGGTLFLDEIGDMPLMLQAKMLRFLQERVVEPVGGRTEIDVDVRVVCATNKDVIAMVAEKSFREDLYYRISEMTINIPPLRERDCDVLLLARAFLHQYNKELATNIKGFNEQALNALTHYPWPGNIRELQNKVKSAAIMADGQQITAEDLGLSNEDDSIPAFNLREIREQTEVQVITQVFTYTNHNISKAAELLGITRPTLYALLDKYMITPGKEAS